MTREATVEKYRPVFMGLLIEAFAVCPSIAGAGPDGDALRGRTLDRQIKKVTDLIGRMYDDLTPPAAANGKPADTQKART